MRLTRLVMLGFLGYETAEVDLSGTSQVAVVGPVGAGKTSHIDAITWALWGEARGSVLDSVIHDGSDRCEVRVEFLLGTQLVAVTRAKTRGGKSALSLEVDGVVQTRATIPETQPVINDLVGLDYATALAGPLMLQGDTGALMGLGPSKRKEVLLGLFGLERFKVLEAAAKEKRDFHALAARSAQSMIDNMGDILTRRTILDTNLQGTKPRAAVRADAVAFGRERIEALSASTATLREKAETALAKQAELDDLREQFKGLKAELHLTEAAVLAAEVSVKDLAANPITYVTPEATAEAQERLQETTRAHATAWSELTGLRRDLKALGERAEITCPDCGKVFRPDVAEGAEEALNVGIAALEEQADQLEAKRVAAQQSLTMLRQEEQKWLEWDRAKVNQQHEMSKNQTRIKVLLPHVEQLAERGKTLRAEIEGMEKVGPDLTSQLDELASARAALETNERDWQALEEEVIRLETQISQLDADIARREQLMAEVAESTEIAETHAVLAKAYHRDGIPTLMLESGLPLIEQRTNDVLSRMPGDFTVRLVTKRATGAGTEEERLDVVVMVGDRPREYEGLSGGQKFRVDLALRLGLTRALSGRTFDTLVIDEGLDRFQDDAGREALLESLTAVAEEFGLVLVVSHHPEVIERFSSRIEVQMDDERVSHAQLV